MTPQEARRLQAAEVPMLEPSFPSPFLSPFDPLLSSILPFSYSVPIDLTPNDLVPQTPQRA